MDISGIAPLESAATMGTRVRLFLGIYLLSMMIEDWVNGVLTCTAMSHQVLGSGEAPGTYVTLSRVMILFV